MKRRIISLVSLVAILTMLFAIVGCGSTEKYDFKTTHTQIDFSDFKGDMDFVYEDTRLNIKEDGTWTIDMRMFLFIRSNIDEGTYTVENGVYSFEGFEYGMKATGKETEEGFEIYFADPLNELRKNVVTLEFEK